VCACSLDHITPSRLGDDTSCRTYNDLSLSIRQLALPASASTTRPDFRLKRSLHPDCQRTRPGRNARSLRFVCVRSHPEARDPRRSGLYPSKVRTRMCGLLRGTGVVVGLGGLEPPTSPLSGVRSNHLSYRPNVAARRRERGGASRDRTDDPLLAKQVLSQLSYGPGVRQPRPKTRPRAGRSGCRSLVRTPDRQCVAFASLKEVIQPHLPIRLPCYDFTPVMNHSVVTVLHLRG
jgi:hypothetical protein